MIAEARTVFVEEFRRAIRRRGWQVITATVPVILVAVLAAVTLFDLNNQRAEEVLPPIGVVDLSGELTGLSTSKESQLGFVSLPSRVAGIAALTDESTKLEHVFVVAPDFIESGRVEWLSTKSGVFAGRSDRDKFDSWLVVSLIADQLDPNQVNRVLTPATYTRLSVDANGTLSPEGDATRFMLPVALALILLMAIVTGSNSLLQSVAEEKENRMIEVLLTAVMPSALMAGKVLALGTTALIGIAVWTTSLAVVGPQILTAFPHVGDLAIEPITLAPVSAFFVAGYFLYAVTLVGVGFLVSSVKETGSVSTLFAIPAIIPVYASGVIVSDPGGTLARVLSFIPFTAPTTMIQRVGSSDVSNLETLASLATILMAGMLMLFVSSKLFRASLLLYGQRATARSIVRALRQTG